MLEATKKYKDQALKIIFVFFQLLIVTLSYFKFEKGQYLVIRETTYDVWAKNLLNGNFYLLKDASDWYECRADNNDSCQVHWGIFPALVRVLINFNYFNSGIYFGISSYFIICTLVITLNIALFQIIDKNFTQTKKGMITIAFFSLPHVLLLYRIDEIYEESILWSITGGLIFLYFFLNKDLSKLKNISLIYLFLNITIHSRVSIGLFCLSAAGLYIISEIKASKTYRNALIHASFFTGSVILFVTYVYELFDGLKLRPFVWITHSEWISRTNLIGQYYSGDFYSIKYIFFNLIQYLRLDSLKIVSYFPFTDAISISDEPQNYLGSLALLRNWNNIIIFNPTYSLSIISFPILILIIMSLVKMKKLKNPESKKVKICVLSSIIPIVFNLVFFSYVTRYIVDWQLFLMILLIYVSNRSEADFKNIKIPLVISTVAAMIIGFTYGVNLRSNFEKNSIKFISSVLPNKSLKYIYPFGKDIRISNHNLSCEELFQPYIIDIGNFSLQDENMIKVSRENPHLAIKFNRNENYEWFIDIDSKNESMTNFRINLMNTNYSYFLFVQPRTYNEITFVVEDKAIHTFVVKDNLIMDNLIKNSWTKRNCKNDNFEVIQDNAKTRWYEII